MGRWASLFSRVNGIGCLLASIRYKRCATRSLPSHRNKASSDNRFMRKLSFLALPLAVAIPTIQAADYRTPAGLRPAHRTEEGAGTVLPGGRLLSPYGTQYTTGPGPFGLAVSPNGNRI